MRLENEKYLRTHAEVKVLISSFMRELLQEKPDNPVVFASKYFTQPGLRKNVLGSSNS